MPTNTTTAIFTTPTSELSAVNIILSGIGEAPVNSLSDTTSDVAVALNILAEVSKEVQTEGWQWNTEDDYPLTPGDDGRIKLHPSIVRVHFRDPDDRELVIRGQYVYDRIRHTYIFPRETAIKVTVTLLLAFEQLPEACRRYITLKSCVSSRNVWWAPTPSPPSTSRTRPAPAPRCRPRNARPTGPTSSRAPCPPPGHGGL